MILLTPDEVKRYLIEKQWVSPGEPLQVEPLTGGVSNQVWRISGEGFRWVMKQALPKLKVEAEWYADVGRIEREREAMSAYGSLLEDGVVPQLLYSDPAAHTYVMTCAPDNAETWKTELMSGRFDPEAAERAGRLLGAMHKRSSGKAEQLREDFDDLAYFEELRIRPFHRHLIRRYPELTDPISRIIGQLTEERTSLVHGDYSPKNILITPDRRLTVLDFEVAHWGNPLFDVAFCAAHLVLKGLALRRKTDAFAMIAAFLDGYGEPDGELLPHLGLLLLARIDGKSPVEYVRDDSLKDIVRDIGKTWIRLADDKASRTEECLLQEIQRVLREDGHDESSEGSQS